MYFIFGFGIALLFFTPPALETFPNYWFIVVLTLAIITGAITHVLFTRLDRRK